MIKTGAFALHSLPEWRERQTMCKQRNIRCWQNTGKLYFFICFFLRFICGESMLIFFLSLSISLSYIFPSNRREFTGAVDFVNKCDVVGEGKGSTGIVMGTSPIFLRKFFFSW